MEKLNYMVPEQLKAVMMGIERAAKPLYKHRDEPSDRGNAYRALSVAYAEVEALYMDNVEPYSGEDVEFCYDHASSLTFHLTLHGDLQEMSR